MSIWLMQCVPTQGGVLFIFFNFLTILPDHRYIGCAFQARVAHSIRTHLNPIPRRSTKNNRVEKNLGRP